MWTGKAKAGGLAIAMVFMATASPASAARYATPNPQGGATCGVSDPCDIAVAINGQAGEIILYPGDYGSESIRLSTILQTSNQVDVHGVDGQPRPRIFTSAQTGLGLFNPASTAHHIHIDRVGSPPGIGFDFSGSLAEDIYVKDVSSANDGACRLNGSGTLRNTVCYGGVTSNAVVISFCPSICTPTLRNVTAWGRFGLSTFAGAGGTNTTVNVVNTSMQGLGDIATSQSNGGTMTINPTYSHYRTTETSFGGTVNDSPTNQHLGNPSWTDTTTGDFHQMPDSALTIDKGITDPANGPTDIDGEARAQGASTDIGADELTVAAPGGGGGSGGSGGSGGGAGGGGGGGGNVKTPQSYAAASAGGPKCLSIPNVVRDRSVKVKGGGKVVLSTRQLDDPSAPLKLSVKVTGGGSIRSAVFTANGKATQGSGKTSSVPVTALKIGNRQNKLKVVVTLASGKKVTVEQKAIILRCTPPATTCKRVGDGHKLTCNSKTPLGGRKVKVTLTGPKGEAASGSASVKKGKYTVTLTSKTALAAGSYAYEAVVRTTRRGERLQMIRLVTVT